MTKIIEIKGDVLYDIDGLSIEDVIKYFEQYSGSGYTFNVQVSYDDTTASIVLKETDEQRTTRLLREREARMLAKREKEYQRYLALKEQFEGENK